MALQTFRGNTNRAIRVYADTSVYGGVFDRAFAKASRRFFHQVQDGDFALVTSALVAEEIGSAPARVQIFYRAMQTKAEVVEISGEALRLAADYVTSGIVGNQWLADARHVALATAAGCRLIVSWNFKHIVHFGRIERYNGINLARGYSAIGIYSPLEVIGDENPGKSTGNRNHPRL